MRNVVEYSPNAERNPDKHATTVSKFSFVGKPNEAKFAHNPGLL
jgi:hypothetical protein